jgi:hypothetical protein
MPTAHLFSYNIFPNGVITGCTQYGDMAVSLNTTDTPGFAVGNMGNPYHGPDEDLGYVIAKASSARGRTHKRGTELAPDAVGFIRSDAKTDASFVTLVNQNFNQSFSLDSSGAVTAKNYLTTNEYWTSWILTYTTGLYKTTYSGYHNENPTFFASATTQAFGTNPTTSVQTTVITEPGTDDGTNFSCQWLGYFKPTTTETYTFFLSSDDGSYLWIGANALSGFTTANSNINNGGPHGPQEVSGSVSLTAGVYYPIRIQFGEIGGGDVMTFNYSTPTITKTTNVTGLVFYNSTTNNF